MPIGDRVLITDRKHQIARDDERRRSGLQKGQSIISRFEAASTLLSLGLDLVFSELSPMTPIKSHPETNTFEETTFAIYPFVIIAIVVEFCAAGSACGAQGVPKATRILVRIEWLNGSRETDCFTKSSRSTLNCMSDESKVETKAAKKTLSFGIVLSILSVLTAVLALGLGAYQGWLSRRSFQLQNRAWLFPDSVTNVDIQEGKPLAIKWVLRNIGSTPAIDVQLSEYEERNSAFQMKHDSDVHANDEALRGLFERANHPKSVTAIGTLGQGSSFIVISPESQEIITASDIERMAQGDQVIFLSEAITYRDIFGKEHLTTMCAYLKLDRERTPFFMKCGLGNDLG